MTWEKVLPVSELPIGPATGPRIFLCGSHCGKPIKVFGETKVPYLRPKRGKCILAQMSSCRLSTTELPSSILGQKPSDFRWRLMASVSNATYAERDLSGLLSSFIPQVFPRKLASCSNLLPFDTRRPNDNICSLLQGMSGVFGTRRGTSSMPVVFFACQGQEHSRQLVFREIMSMPVQKSYDVRCCSHLHIFDLDPEGDFCWPRPSER